MFAFFAAGVSITGAGAPGITDPIVLGIVTGLVVGKAVGVLGATWLVQRFTGAQRAEGVSRWDAVPEVYQRGEERWRPARSSFADRDGEAAPSGHLTTAATRCARCPSSRVLEPSRTISRSRGSWYSIVFGLLLADVGRAPLRRSTTPPSRRG